MSESSKKQTFLHGAALLAIATAVVKIIGALYKIPLKMIIGDQGYGYFTTAYDIYSVLLMISTAGLPIAMSRMISQANSLGKYNQVRQVYKTSRTIFLALGIFSTALMVFGCRWLANILGQPDAWASILCLGPCALFMGFMSAYRGFFQGQENMRPTSRSQMVEAASKLVVGLLVAYGVMKATSSVSLAAGGAILGVTFSCLVSTIFLMAIFRPAYRELPASDDTGRSFGTTAKELLAIAVPITIGSAGLQLLTVVETGLYMDRLVGLFQAGHFTPLASMLQAEILEKTQGIVSEDLYSQVASSIKGIYNFAQTVFNMPCSFIIPITASVLPAITAQLTLKKDEAVRGTEESAARITGLLSLPCCIGLFVLAGPVMGLLGGYAGLRLELARQLMAMLAICIFLYAIIQYTNVVLQSHGLAHIPVINMLAAGVIKLVVVYLLTGNPALGILGVPIGTILCYAAIAAMNLISISVKIPQKPRLLQNLLRPALPALLMGGIVFLCHQGLLMLLGSDASNLILCAGPIAVGAVVYLVLVVIFRAIRKEDLELIPKGNKVAKLLRLK